MSVAKQSEIRREVLEFASEMETKLQRNDYKGGWHAETLGRLLANLKGEVIEAEAALSRFLASTWAEVDEEEHANAAVCELADVANYCMMLAERVRTIQRAAMKSKRIVEGETSEGKIGNPDPSCELQHVTRVRCCDCKITAEFPWKGLVTRFDPSAEDEGASFWDLLRGFLRSSDRQVNRRLIKADWAARGSGRWNKSYRCPACVELAR